MQKIIVGLSLFFLSNTLYSQGKELPIFKIKDINQKEIKSTDFKGKKLAIVVFDISKMDDKTLQVLLSLDSLSKLHKNKFSVIAASTVSENIKLNEKECKELLKSTVKLSYPIFFIENTDKKNEEKQHGLFKWLTNKSQNIHFDNDVSGGTQIFVINEAGILFAELNTAFRKFSRSEFELILEQNNIQ
ncbi:MAG: hypothetical protein K2Q21_02510 [Chitinophagaceae bacterium]|nr:hypothetical protein [Chitinophagaceae bacterium]